MSLPDAVRLLNTLKKRRVIKDYALMGAVAATVYMEPVFTEDLDIIVLVDTDEAYRQAFRRMAEFAEGQEGMHYVLAGVPVQMFPTTTKPLYHNALETARKARIGDVRVKVASPEHLILLYLEAYREKDHFRIRHLLPVADMEYLNGLLERFDDEEGLLAHRLQTLR